MWSLDLLEIAAKSPSNQTMSLAAVSIRNIYVYMLVYIRISQSPLVLSLPPKTLQQSELC